jgi:hypothetical protein
MTYVDLTAYLRSVLRDGQESCFEAKVGSQSGGNTRAKIREIQFEKSEERIEERRFAAEKQRKLNEAALARELRDKQREDDPDGVFAGALGLGGSTAAPAASGGGLDPATKMLVEEFRRNQDRADEERRADRAAQAERERKQVEAQAKQTEVLGRLAEGLGSVAQRVSALASGPSAPAASGALAVDPLAAMAAQIEDLKRRLEAPPPPPASSPPSLQDVAAVVARTVAEVIKPAIERTAAPAVSSQVVMQESVGMANTLLDIAARLAPKPVEGPRPLSPEEQDARTARVVAEVLKAAGIGAAPAAAVAQTAASSRGRGLGGGDLAGAIGLVRDLGKVHGEIGEALGLSDKAPEAAAPVPALFTEMDGYKVPLGEDGRPELTFTGLVAGNFPKIIGLASNVVSSGMAEIKSARQASVENVRAVASAAERQAQAARASAEAVEREAAARERLVNAKVTEIQVDAEARAQAQAQASAPAPEPTFEPPAGSA